MRRRVLDFVPTYRDTLNHNGAIVASRYLGHIALYPKGGA